MSKTKTTYLLLLLAFLLTGQLLKAQKRVSSSKITCLEILDDNRVRVTWSKSDIEPDLFDSYTLRHSQSKDGPFVTIGTFPDENTTTFTHVGINANLNRQYYEIKVNSGQDPGISPVAGTLFIIGIDVNPNGYQAALYWEPFSEPLPDNDAYYTVYKYKSGLPLSIGTTTDNFYKNIEVFTCLDSVNFSITIDIDGCSSNSQIVGDWFTDKFSPDKPELDSVSVTPDGQTIIGWTQSDSLDTQGNIVYRYDGAKWNPFDLVYGYNTKVYIDTIINPCEENYQYAISSFDSCGNNSPFTDKTAQRPVFLYDIPYSVCDLKTNLTWEKYINPKYPIEHYEIWRSKNGVDFDKIGSVSGTVTSYTDTDIDPGLEYTYFIRAKMGNITSSSCRKPVQTFSYKLPQFLETITADVLEDNTVNVTVNGDLDVYKCTWDIWRFGSGQPDTVNVDQQTIPGQTTSPFIVSDGEVDASVNPWFYYSTVVDSCGILRIKSNDFKTIWLQGYTQDNVNYLNWTASEGWSNGVEKYYIYRTVPGVDPVSPIDSVDGNTLQYNEPAPASGVEDGRTIYFVQALKKTSNGERITSNSNRTPLYKEASLYFPNAFLPDGKNKEFKPVYSFFGGNTYLFQIYDRWGKLIFETQNISEGWDGNINSNPAEAGAYIYMVSYHSVNGNTVNHKGTVMLIR